MPSGVYEHKHTPWNKGLHVRLNPKGEFKKGSVAWNKGKEWSEEIKRKVSKTKKSQNRKMTDREKKILSEYNKRIGKIPPHYKGENHPSWLGGKSFEEYPTDWTKTLKRSIRERDNYICQLCSKQQGDEALSVHHIDYDKNNCNPDNLISLCRKCHGITTKNRKYWTDYFIRIICSFKLLE